VVNRITVAGFAGAAVMIGPDALRSVKASLLARLACLAAALSYAFAGIFGRSFQRMGVAPLATAAGKVSASTLMLLPIMLPADRPWELAVPHSSTWGAVFGLGLASTALAYALYFRILAAAGDTNLLLVTFLIPVSAILLGALVLGETLLPRHFLGMALIGVGLAFIDRRLPRLLLRRRSEVGTNCLAHVGPHSPDTTAAPLGDHWSQGLITGTRVSAKSATLRVTMILP
jgi:drug/metabolite transporter (DMT)-like permease